VRRVAATEDSVMPKMKTNSSAKKRFKVTGSGRVRRGTAGLSHMMIGKSANRRRGLRKNSMVSDADEKRIKKMLPYD
jgi:large subunit ribosomal protein L35